MGLIILVQKTRRFFKERFPSALLKRLDIDVDQIETANVSNLMGIYNFICLSDYPSLVDALIPLLDKQLDVQVIKVAADKNIPQINLDNVEQVTGKTEHIFPSVSIERLEDLVNSYKKHCTIKNLEKKYEILLLVAKKVDPYIDGKLLNIVDRMRKKGYSEEVIKKNTWYYEKIILEARNKVWFPKIKKAYQEHGSVFVAVGVGHFIDAYNLQDMLKADGFSVKRYNSNCIVE